jgi:hypothetical protein
MEDMNDHFTRSELKKRGWSDWLIGRHLGTCDATGSDVAQFFRASRVADAERTTECKQGLADLAAAKRTAATMAELFSSRSATDRAPHGVTGS